MSGYGLVAAMRLREQCANSNELLTLLAIANYVDEHGRGCYASRQTLAESVLISEETVKRCIPRLAAKGLITPGDSAMVAHLRADRRPNVWDLACARVTPRATGQDAVSAPVETTGGLSAPPLDVTGGQMISARGVCQTPNPVMGKPANLLPGVALEGDAAPGAARQAGQTHTHNPNGADGSAAAQDAAEALPVDGGEERRSDEAAAINSAPVVGSPDVAVKVIDSVDFGRPLTRSEQAGMAARLGVLLAGGHAPEALAAKDLGGSRNRVAVYRDWLKSLPDVAPVAPAVKRAPTVAEAFAATEAALDADAESDADREAGRRWREQRAAQRALSAQQAGSGAVAPGAATKRREAAVSVSAGLSRFSVSDLRTGRRCRFRRRRSGPAARP